MAEEEFQESEVIFADNSSNDYGTHNEDATDDADGYFGKSEKNTQKSKMDAGSVPVNIPLRNSSFSFDYGAEADGFDGVKDDDGEGEIVPPHVILGRRFAAKMAFSVFTGNGRTLKGRDLSQVRNSILRMTGFLEA